MSDPRSGALPQGLHTVTPHLLCRDAAAIIDFCVRAFGATEALRLPAPGGRIMHAQIRIGDSAVMLADTHPDCGSRDPDGLGGTPVVLHLQVPDVDAIYDRALAAGAVSVMPPQDMFWGDRYGQVRDPNGHVWALATHVRDVSPDELLAAAAAMAGHCAPKEA